VDRVRYANSGDHHLAYRLLDGASTREVVLFTPGGTIPMEFLERDRVGRRLLDGLAAIGRVVLFDRRGIGMSDPITDWSRPLVEQWADDLAAIVATACSVAPVVVAMTDYWGPARLFAADHPHALSELVLYEPAGPIGGVDLSTGVHENWIARVCPSRAHDDAFVEWFNTAGRTGASPGVAARIYELPQAHCIERLTAGQGRIAVPTLVLRRPANLMGSATYPDPVASAIPGARRVDLPGRDFHWLGNDIDSLLVEISRFVTGHERLPTPERELRAVIFTDLVGSTERLAVLGDVRWKTLLDHHDAEIQRAVAHNGGVLVKTTGDGVLATFPSADRALCAAHRIRQGFAAEQLGVRVGIHVGDVERREDDVAGIAVHIAARVMSLAAAGDVLVTGSVPIAAAGSDHDFEAAGDHTLKGVPGVWTVFRAVAKPE
jgi:class 3 adenylate cyclase/pimeloyl-ACP methyl ester carboxylesterase